MLILLVGYGFVMFQHHFVPQNFKILFFVIFVFAEYLVFFAVVKPSNPYQLANLLALVLGLAAALIILVQDILIRHMVSYRFLIILGGTIGLPYLSAMLYKIFRKR